MSTVFYFFLQSFFAPVEGGVRQCGWLCAKTADIRLFCCKNIYWISGRSGGSGLHSAQFYVIISDELNRKQQVPSATLRGGKGKREAGADPARSRHCDKGACRQGAFAPVTEHCLGRRRQALSFQPGNLPAVGTGALLQITRNWLYLKSSWKIRGVFLRCRSAHRKTLVFLWQFCLQSCCAWVLFPVPVFQQMDLP